MQGFTLLDEAYNHDVMGTLLAAGRYMSVEFSSDELLAVLNNIADITTERYAAYQCIYSYNVSSMFTDVRNNSVVVTLVEYNEHMVEGFRRYVYDSPALELRQGDRLDLGGGQGSATIAIVMVIGTIIIAAGIISAIRKRKRNHGTRYL